MGIDGLVVEPRTVARFPLQSTDHAELGRTATGHVVAAFFEFNHGGAIVTSLPTFLPGDLGQGFHLGIFGTVARDVHLLRTNPADSSLALLAPANFAAVFNLHMMWFDPRATPPGGAVYPVFRLEFIIFAIP